MFEHAVSCFVFEHTVLYGISVTLVCSICKFKLIFCHIHATGMQVLEWNGVLLTGKTYEEVQCIMAQPCAEAELCVRL